MNDDIYSFDKDFEPGDFEDVQRRFRDNEDREEAMKKHPAGTKATKTTTPQVSDEAKNFVGANVFKFFFVTIPMALLFAGLAVQPLLEAAWGIDLGFWTAFFVLATLRWLIPRPSKKILVQPFSVKKGR